MAENNSERLKIKDLALEDRPREKLMARGIDTLSNAELVAILIGSGNRNETAVQLSQRILNSVDNNLNQFGKVSISELVKNFVGIGEAKAISIVAALELGKRRKSADIIERKKITGVEDVFSLFQPMLCDLPFEEFWILLLNQANKIIAKQKISQGGVAATVVDVRLILKPAIEMLASGVILIHNHPSGATKPSHEDIQLTKKVRDACSLVNINLLDHIIIGDTNHYSFANEGMLTNA